MNKRGQAMTEMMFILPLLLMLAVGVLGVVFMCWQGIKVQQAANIAARIQGQERVAGGPSTAMIQQDNGVALGGDSDPTSASKPLDAGQLAALRQSRKVRPGSSTVYGKIQKVVRGMFNPGDQQDLFVPMPKYGLVGYSDQVKVVRLWQLPQIFGFAPDPVTLQATAYGGEDTHMYGLVRWGHASASNLGSQSQFWSQKDAKGNRENLPNPQHD